MAPSTGSPAIDSVTYNTPNGCPDTDQRGVARPQGTACDSGAFEVEQYTLTMRISGPGSVTPTVGSYLYLTGTLVPITATAETGHALAEWSGDLSAVDDSPTSLGSVTTLTATLTSGLDVTYAWNFGDSNLGVGLVVTHTYAVAGTYTAIATATNSAGSASAQTTVYVTTNPIAQAGLDQIVRTGQPVTLDGSASVDPGNFLPLAYHWQQTGGPAVTLNGADHVTATFASPLVSWTQALTFTLTVTNLQSVVSLPDMVVVTVEPYRILLPLVRK